MDRRTASSPPLPAQYTALEPIDLDKSVVERGMIFGTGAMQPPKPEEHDDWNVRVFKPMFEQLTPDARA